MSAQGLNASSSNYRGYSLTADNNNPSGAAPTRDASDITRQIKERLLYLNSKDATTINTNKSNLVLQRPQVNPAGVNHIPGNSEWSWVPYGNQYRLSYFFGKMKGCASSACGGALFNGNGPVLPGSNNGTTGS